MEERTDRPHKVSTQTHRRTYGVDTREVRAQKVLLLLKSNNIATNTSLARLVLVAILLLFNKSSTFWARTSLVSTPYVRLCVCVLTLWGRSVRSSTPRLRVSHELRVTLRCSYTLKLCQLRGLEPVPHLLKSNIIATNTSLARLVLVAIILLFNKCGTGSSPRS